MNRLFKHLLWCIFPACLACEDGDYKKASHLDAVISNKYYSEEVIPSGCQSIYGRWKLTKISGGFSGAGYTPDYDYLELKSAGIYGLIRNDSLFEYGRIALDTFDVDQPEVLQVKFIADYHTGTEPYMANAEKYVEFESGSLDLNSPCCDMYNYHFEKAK